MIYYDNFEMVTFSIQDMLYTLHTFIRVVAGATVY